MGFPKGGPHSSLLLRGFVGGSHSLTMLLLPALKLIGALLQLEFAGRHCLVGRIELLLVRSNRLLACHQVCLLEMGLLLAAGKVDHQEVELFLTL